MQVSPRAPLGSWFYLGRRQTTTWHFCGQHHHRSFCGSLHCGFPADTTHPTPGSLTRNQPLAPRSGPSGKLLLLAASVALHRRCQVRQAKPRRAHRSPSCTQRSKPPINQPPAIFRVHQALSTPVPAPAPAPVPVPGSISLLDSYLHHASVPCAVPVANEP